MKILIITQARIGSSRLPNKVLMKIGNDTMLGLHLKRLAKSKNAYKVVVATTKEDVTTEAIWLCKKAGNNQGFVNNAEKFSNTNLPLSKIS